MSTFQCVGCGACCCVPGVVRLTEGDIPRLAKALGLTEDVFIQTYTELSPSRTSLILKGYLDGPCIFLDKQRHCRVYEGRPQQCRDYPERWQSKEIEAVCLGRLRQQKKEES